ncbi:Transcriptional regulator, IclR family OS=Tsukamurella paurometabola (strain ATCC 8368 / DSM/ CCUG 35730 / CIP 100753 / JCM 10117 / KCTC 9821 / NBRC 16120/ NCIMB 702349 / NCTC 13040) OX=521096 GN=Tpau_3009 PE=4 SV=1 [Tsukamurella paurometabola]|uniref:Transcriptional regulator, IclR family n=1 Tax=Tsukamurella paurometabola (strain ATCC 8368 / DSM 20162 / CCUG 35730 / CIP 100753 / JCM 10117 / KCTC 9821 / NBRC 16120 / NCIMB 702349 / NCTC 13040) TaxID=521096 RepID=D5UUA1_TSUPD|nr:IclR family transcriptional regulator [Tsukamurella paurometabola]ADG79604.1 transcriptional regulator, IclR family [Tsukamurella paurometabola DSM 20162]SUP36407.1 Transcriptional regulator kdgR [Tsukamurella paurometabola]
MSQSLTRALDILTLLGEGPASLDDLADSLGVHKTTVLRLLRPLVDARFAYHDEQHRYHLGSRVFDLAARASEQRSIRSIAAPHLIAFNREYGRTTHLAAREGDAVVYIDKLESRDLIRMYSRVGMEANLNSSAVGKLLLASLPDAELKPIVATMDFTRRTANTIVTPQEYLAEIARVREQDWATDREENEPSINCIGAPVRDASGTTVAAVSVSVPDVVLPFEDLLDLLDPLRATCAAISADCGYRPR